MNRGSFGVVDLDVRIAKKLHDLIFVESRDPFAAEVVGYVHAGIGGSLFIALVVLAHLAVAISVGVGILAFVLLRLLLVNRYTVWIGALLGTLFVASIAAALGWFVAHALDDVRAPLIFGIAFGIGGAIPAIIAYKRLIERRAENDRDSLLPSSRASMPSSSR